MKTELQKLDISESIINKAEKQILATKTHLFEYDSDTNFLIDADLSILGENPSKFSDYAN